MQLINDEKMNIKFKDIDPGIYLAKVFTINVERGPYGEFLRFNFVILEGDLKGCFFNGIIKPNPLKISKFYRWITTIMGQEPAETFLIDDLIGKQCRISLQRKDKGGRTFYSVVDLF